MCKSNGVIKQANIVHHIVPLRDDWSKRLSYDNLETICAQCHNAEHPEKGAKIENKQKYRKRMQKKQSESIFKFSNQEFLG